MKVDLQYGKSGIAITLPDAAIDILEPKFVEGLKDEAASFQEAVRNPIESRPLRELVKPSDRVAVVIPDITRHLPSHKLLPWLFEELQAVPADRFTIITGTGTHRPNTPEELAGMVGKDVLNKYRVINHSAFEKEQLTQVGTFDGPHPVLLNKEYVEADKRIIMGFIEPHFMAGFSGGYKGVFPAVAGIDSILHYHRASVIGDPRSIWGQLENNPTQDIVRTCGAMVPVDFCINLTLNRNVEITRYFCGDVLAAHTQGCAFAKETAMTPCDHRYPLVITTNGGYPLDQNLYQAVKGMSAAAQIIEDGGRIIVAARCNDGFPAHGNFADMISTGEPPEKVLEKIEAPGFHKLDQWQAQLLSMYLIKANIALYSELPANRVAKAQMEPIADLEAYIKDKIEALNEGQRVAVLPEGPMTIPYVRQGVLAK